MDDRYLGPEQLAERYDVPLETIYGWNKAGTAPPRIRVGRHVRYLLADVIKWERDRRVADKQVSA